MRKFLDSIKVNFYYYYCRSSILRLFVTLFIFISFCLLVSYINFLFPTSGNIISIMFT